MSDCPTPPSSPPRPSSTKFRCFSFHLVVHWPEKIQKEQVNNIGKRSLVVALLCPSLRIPNPADHLTERISTIPKVHTHKHARLQYLGRAAMYSRATDRSDVAVVADAGSAPPRTPAWQRCLDANKPPCFPCAMYQSGLFGSSWSHCSEHTPSPACQRGLVADKRPCWKWSFIILLNFLNPALGKMQALNPSALRNVSLMNLCATRQLM